MAAVEAKIASAVIVWNNASYGEIKAMMAERDIPQIGVDIRPPDFVALGKAMGCFAAAPHDLEGFKAELAASVLRDVPTLIEIRDPSPLAAILAATRA